MPTPLRSSESSTSTQRHDDLLPKSVASRLPTCALFSSSQRPLHSGDQLDATSAGVAVPGRWSAGAENRAVLSKPLALRRGSAPATRGWARSWRLSPPSFTQRLAPKPCVHAVYRAAWLCGRAFAAYRGGDLLGRRGEFGLPGSWWLSHTERLTRQCSGRAASRPAADRQTR